MALLVNCSMKKDDSTVDEILNKSSSYESTLMDKYRVHLYRIDNRVKVYANDDLIYTSEFIEGNPELDITLGLSDYLTTGKNTVKIELYNGGPLWELAQSMDEKWEIFYEIFYKNEPIDYIHEQSSNGQSGMVYSTTHEIYVE